MTEQAPLFDSLPQYQDDLDKIKEKKRKAFQNDLCVQLNRLMNHFKVEAADIVKGTSLSFSTMSGWINNKTEVQLLDSNVKEVARFFNVSVDFLAFGVPISERDFEINNVMEKNEEKSA